MEWYLKCFKQYADFSGRARRKEYWMFFLFNMLISIVFGLIDKLLGLTSELGLGIFGGIYMVAAWLPGLAVGVRRLHDVGKSGWNFLFILIPLAGAIALLVWFCKEGESGSNAWGNDSKEEREKDELFHQQMFEQPQNKTTNIKEKILELKKLQDEGLLTQEEFDKAKAKLIDEI